MGSSGSKTARAAGQAAARKYPARPTGNPSAPAAQTNAPSRTPPAGANHQPGPTVKPQTHASGERDEAINLDASDPDFARSLRSLGAVQPNPTLSPSSTFNSSASTPTTYGINSPNSPQNSNNHSISSPYSGTQYPVFPDPSKNPAVMLLQARSRIQEAADHEFLEAGKRGFQGREFLDVAVLRQVLLMRERGVGDGKIEEQLGLKRGVVGRLGARGVVGTVAEVSAS